MARGEKGFEAIFYVTLSCKFNLERGIQMYQDKMFREYLATELSITERAVRIMLEKDPDKYKKLLVGSLVLNEVDIESFLENATTENKKIFITEKDTKK